MKKCKIPAATIRRLPVYYRHLGKMKARGVQRVSSTMLGKHAGINSSLIRQDLSCFGKFGLPGRGYSVTHLLEEIRDILGINNRYTAIVLGTNPLMKIFIQCFPFEKCGVAATDLYDAAPVLTDSNVSGIPVRLANELPDRLARDPVDIVVLVGSVGDWADKVVRTGGIRGIWNLTNTELKFCNVTPVIENVHLLDSLLSLSCTLNGF